MICLKDLKQFLRPDAGPWSQFFKYAVAGGMATAVHILLFFLLGWRLLPCLTPDDFIARLLDITPQAVPQARRALNAALATAAAFLVANAVAYILNVVFVFQRGRHRRLIEIGMFYLVSAISVFVGTTLQSILIAKYGVMTTIAFGTNIFASLLINFTVRKYFIFQNTKAAPNRADDPHAPRPLSLTALTAGLWRHRQLIIQMTRRDVIGRYKGSVMGLLWSFINPVFMLTVYTFVFAVVFQTRWTGEPSDSKTQFAIILFAGLIVHGLFAEILNRAPGLIVGNANYVKKVVFPLEILPVVSLGAALFHALVSLGVLLMAFVVFNGYLYWTVLLTPLVLLPLAVLSLGLGWILSSLGVYLRDVGQTVAIITLVMLFMAPVFYPLSALPEAVRPWIKLNPLTVIIEQARAVLVWGHWPDWTALGIYMLIALTVAWAGYAWFQKTRNGFADVL